MVLSCFFATNIWKAPNFTFLNFKSLNNSRIPLKNDKTAIVFSQKFSLCDFLFLPLQPLNDNSRNGAIAQLVEQRTENPCVPGSIPGGTTIEC